MWLTPHFPDLCRSSCIYNAMGAHGPCPATFNVQLRPLCKAMTCVEGKCDSIIHHRIEDTFSINRLLVYDNCYAISCHSLE